MTEKDKPEQEEQTKRPVGRPPLEFPEQIDASPEEIAKAMFGGEDKKAHEWKYMKESNKTKR